MVIGTGRDKNTFGDLKWFCEPLSREVDPCVNFCSILPFKVVVNMEPAGFLESFQVPVGAVGHMSTDFEESKGVRWPDTIESPTVELPVPVLRSLQEPHFWIEPVCSYANSSAEEELNFTWITNRKETSAFKEEGTLLWEEEVKAIGLDLELFHVDLSNVWIHGPVEREARFQIVLEIQSDFADPIRLLAQYPCS